MALEFLAAEDPQVTDCLRQELARQRGSVELIASENFTSPRRHGGRGQRAHQQVRRRATPASATTAAARCVDVVEDLARDRACKLFGAEHANVQPHSGAQRQLRRVSLPCIEPGDTVLGMSLDQRRPPHPRQPRELLRQATTTSSPTAWTPRPRPSTTTSSSDIAKECRPKVIVGGRLGLPRASSTSSACAEIAHEVGAYLMVDMAHIAGLVAAGLHPSPVPYADVVTTTTHKTLRGPRGGFILANREELRRSHRQGHLPRCPGRPARCTSSPAKAVAFGEALQPEFTEFIMEHVVENCRTSSARA